MQGVWHTNLQITDQYTKTRWIFIENKIDPKKIPEIVAFVERIKIIIIINTINTIFITSSAITFHHYKSMSLSKSSSEYFIIEVFCAGSLGVDLGCVDGRNAVDLDPSALLFGRAKS